MNDEKKAFDVQDFLSKLPGNLKNLVSQVDGKSFATGGAIGTAAGTAVTIVFQRLNSNGVLDPLKEFVDYVKAWPGVEVVAADVVEVPLDGDSEVIEVVAEIVDEEGSGV